MYSDMLLNVALALFLSSSTYSGKHSVKSSNLQGYEYMFMGPLTPLRVLTSIYEQISGLQVGGRSENGSIAENLTG